MTNVGKAIVGSVIMSNLKEKRWQSNERDGGTDGGKDVANNRRVAPMHPQIRENSGIIFN